jgi:hypothetical protein
MSGTDRVRHCSDCRKNVYNLSEMSREAVTSLIVEKEGNICVKFYRRFDGTVLTNDCPRGLRAVRSQYLKARARTFSMAASLLAVLGFSACSSFGTQTMGDLVDPNPRDSTLSDSTSKNLGGQRFGEPVRIQPRQIR